MITDRISRRTQLLSSTGAIIVLFTIITTLNATNVVGTVDGPAAKSADTARAQIAMIFLFGFIFSAGWTPNQALYPVECLRYETRAKGMAMYNASLPRSSRQVLLTRCQGFLLYCVFLQHLCHRGCIYEAKIVLEVS
jgi:Sugar (and other) transporter